MDFLSLIPALEPCSPSGSQGLLCTAQYHSCSITRKCISNHVAVWAALLREHVAQCHLCLQHLFYIIYCTQNNKFQFSVVSENSLRCNEQRDMDTFFKWLPACQPICSLFLVYKHIEVAEGWAIYLRMRNCKGERWVPLDFILSLKCTESAWLTK